MKASLLLLFSALLLSVPVHGNEPSGDEAQLASLLDEFLAGASENNAAVHERFWSDSLVYTSSDGTRFGKDAIMAGLRAAAAADGAVEDRPRYWAEEVDIRVIDDTAVVTFRLKAELPTGGGEAPEQRDYFNTGTFLREAGSWRAIAWQATVAAPQPKPQLKP